MFRKAAIACLFSALAGVHVAYGQDVTAVVDRDIRLFVISAALNVAGFDSELAPRYHPVRELLRERLADVDEDLARRLREFYQAHKGNGSDEDQLAAYLSLALSATPPPGLTLLYEEALTPLDARAVEDFLPLASELYTKANLLQLWSRLAPDYDEGLDRLVAPVRDLLLRSEAYLRLPSGTTSGRREVILLELSLPINSVNIRNYPDNLYIVLGEPGSVSTDLIRHGYLHLQLDPLIAAHRDELRATADLLTLVAGVDGVRAEYTGDAETMIGESLIRAAELRMDDPGSETSDGDLDRSYREGLLLAPYFYEGLQEFEQTDLSIREYLREMISDLDIASEQQRFEDRFFNIAPTPSQPIRAEVPVPTKDPVRAVLEDAEAAFNSGGYETAHALFEQVLDELDPDNGAALYGMALLASREQDSELAREYFSRAIASGSAEPSMVVWSHIYLGRIDDIVCQREAAIGHYRSALEVGDDTNNARSAALSGLEAPFGDNCSDF